MNGFVYILRDKSGRYYMGSTNDLERRLRAHDLGHTQTTRNMICPELVLSQMYDSLVEARVTEKWLKGLKRKDYIAKIVSEGRIDRLPSSFNG